MNKLLLLLTLIPCLAFGQTTYVPDDAFEDYLETTFPAADNGIANDNYVLTSGLSPLNGNLFLTPLYLNGIIFDLTGIEDITDVAIIEIQEQLVEIIDLSVIPNNYPDGIRIGVSECNALTTLILPPNNIWTLEIRSNTLLANLQFHNSSVFVDPGTVFNISDNPSLQVIDMSNISVATTSGSLFIQSNPILNQLNLANGFCNYWDWVFIPYNPNLFCVQVDDPSYCEISTAWDWVEQQTDPSTYSYSTDCGYPVLSIPEPPTKPKELLTITDILGRTTLPKPNTLLFYIYEDGSVEKKIQLER